MQLHLESTALSNNFSYFFVLLGPRFDATIPYMAHALKRVFGGEWRPIVVYSSHPAQAFLKENYIVINKVAEEVEDTVGRHVVLLQEYEDLNNEFVTSPEVQNLIELLKKKQKTVVIIPFTTSFLEIDDPNVLVVGPDRHLAKRFDDKIVQFSLFEKLALPRNTAQIFASQSEVLAAKSRILPCYITASYSSGGNESGLIYSEKMLRKFFSKLRDINAGGMFLVSKIFDGLVLAPNTNAIITNNGHTHVLAITDQILRGNRYLGNIYPSMVDIHHKNQIIEVTQKIGTYLAKEGYRGLFGLDFLLNIEGELVVVDLNPRRQGGYGCNLLALNSLGIDLFELELKTTLREETPLNLPVDGANIPYVWAHSKVKPSDPGQCVRDERQFGDLETIFTSPSGQYGATFSTKGSVFIDGYTGYAAVTGQDRKQVVKELEDNISELLSTTLL